MNIRNIISSAPIEAMGMMIYIINIGLSFLVGVILARNLGSEMYGKYSYVLAWLALAISFVSAGFPALLIREITAYRQNQQYEFIGGIIRVASIFVTLVSGLLIAGVLLAVALGKMPEWDFGLILAVLLALLFLSWTTILESLIRGLGYVIVGQLSNKIISPFTQFLLLSILALGFYGEPLTTKTALYAFAISTFIGFLFTVLILQKKRRNYVSLRKKYDIRSWYSSFWRISSRGWMAVLNLQLGVVLLGILGDEVEVARYKVAAQIAMLIPFGLQVMNSIQLPILSKAYNSGDKEQLQYLASRSCSISFFTALPILMIATVLGEELILKVFGLEYQGAGMILFILSLGQLLNVSAGSSGLIMLVLRNEHILMMTQAAVLLINIVLCIILIPRMGGMGAAIASAISLSLMNIYLVFRIYREMGIVSLPGFYKI